MFFIDKNIILSFLYTYFVKYTFFAIHESFFKKSDRTKIETIFLDIPV